MTKGNSPIWILFVIAIAAAAFVFFAKNLQKSGVSTPNLPGTSSQVNWQFDQESKTWKANGNPPDCPNPFTFPSPADVNLATGILYPGQFRGGEYKPHGGFRFDNQSDNNINVYAPFDGSVVQAARHTSGNSVQYVIYVVNDCGMSYKFDHLLEVTEKLQKMFEKVPLAGENNTRTTFINPPVFISKGELVATKVGLPGNVFFDFGVYDFRQKNGVDYSGKNIFNVERYGEYGICWLDYLQGSDKTLAKSLPGADGVNGKTSDYCK